MIRRDELLEAIDECQREPMNYSSVEKLANLLTVYDHYFSEPQTRAEIVPEKIIDRWGDTDFLRIVDGKESKKVWAVLDELLEAVKVLQPRLYDSAIDKLSDL